LGSTWPGLFIRTPGWALFQTEHWSLDWLWLTVRTELCAEKGLSPGWERSAEKRRGTHPVGKLQSPPHEWHHASLTTIDPWMFRRLLIQ
jgi:hypothetical protein